MSRPTRKMVNLSIEETSGVDHPAHLHEGWLVMKSADAVDVEKAMGSTQADDSEEMPSDLKATKEVSVDEQQSEDKKPSYEDLMAKLKKAEDRIAEMEKEYGDKMKMSKSLDEDVLKEAPAEVREAFESIRKAAQDAQIERDAMEETLRKERNDRADAEAVVKARESYSNLGLDASVVGPALRRLADTDADLAKSVETVLLAANAKVESADIFAEIGKARPSLGGAFERAEAMAKAAVAGGNSATFEQALTDVFASNPDLYSQYRAEQAGR